MSVVFKNDDNSAKSSLLFTKYFSAAVLFAKLLLVMLHMPYIYGLFINTRNPLLISQHENPEFSNSENPAGPKVQNSELGQSRQKKQ